MLLRCRHVIHMQTRRYFTLQAKDEVRASEAATAEGDFSRRYIRVKSKHADTLTLCLMLQDDANEWKMRYDEENGISNSMHDAPAAAPRLTTPVGTADEDHVGSMADLVSPPLPFPRALCAAWQKGGARAALVVRSKGLGCVG